MYKVTVTLTQGARSKQIKGYSTLEEVFDQMANSSATNLRTFTHNLQSARKKSKVEYDKLKTSRCPGFIIGKFKERNDSGCEEYIPLLGFDIDAIPTEGETLLLLDHLKSSPYVYAAYPSPSRLGLRVFIWCTSTQDTHKAVYQSTAQYLSSFTNLPLKRNRNGYIDPSTKNLSRIWFYTSIEKDDLYVNPDSETYHPAPKPPVPPKKKEKTLTPAGNTAAATAATDTEQPLTEDDIVAICYEMEAMRNVPDGRNNHVHFVSKLLYEHGVSEARIRQELERRAEPDFPVQEIHDTIRKALKNATVKYTEEQLRHWKAKKEGRPASTKKLRSVSDDDWENMNKFQKMRHFLERRYAFRYNTIANKLEYKEAQNPISKWRGMDDDNAVVGQHALNENDIEVELLEAGFSGVKDILKTLLMSSRFSPRHNPIAEYFENLPDWDGQTDHIAKLASYVKTTDQTFWAYQFKKALVRSAACALNQLPFNKHCLVLKGVQNDGKTSFWRFLCPPKLKPYYTEQMDFGSKDGRIALAQNFLVNLDELANMARYEIKQVKSFLTYDKVKERLPYGSTFKNFRRIANFFATTNESEFLTDSTGNVRWIVFEVRSIDHRNGKGYPKEVDINQVWAQAYALLQQGFECQLTKEDIEISEKNNAGFLQRTVEMELIQRTLEPASKKDGAFMTATEVLQKLEEQTKQKISRVQVGKALQALGFEKVQRYDNKRKFQIKGYYVRDISEQS